MSETREDQLRQALHMWISEGETLLETAERALLESRAQLAELAAEEIPADNRPREWAVSQEIGAIGLFISRVTRLRGPTDDRSGAWLAMKD